MSEGKKPEKVIPIIIDGFEINAQNVTFQKLQEFSVNLFEKLLYQRKDRNFLMLDRDKLRMILENIRHDIKVARDTAFIRDQELECTEAKNCQDVKEADQEVKFILYDQNINLAELKWFESDLLTKTAEKNLAEELEQWSRKRQLKEKLAEREIKQEEEMANIKHKHFEEIINIKKSYEQIQIKHEIELRKDFNTTMDQLTLKHEMEMSEAEERKNTHLAELKQIHKTRLVDMKDFFNSITAENLTVIYNLKQSLDGMKKNKNVMTGEVKMLKQENKNLQEPLTKSVAEVKNLTRQLNNYKKDLLSLKINKRIQKQTTEEIKQLKKQSSLMFKKIKSNDDQDFINSLNSSCLYSLMGFKGNVGRRRYQLEELISKLLEELEVKNKIIKTLTVDSDIQQALMEQTFEYWNPNKLSYELALICKEHDELFWTLEEKLDEFCILPEKEMDIKPIAAQLIAKNPASLVAKQ